MSRIHPMLLLTVAGAIAAPTELLQAQNNRLAEASTPAPRYTAAATVRYGDAVRLGNGHARAYIVVEEKTGAPRELGVAFDASALEGLPAGGSGHHGNGGDGAPPPMTHEYILSLPAGNKTPFTFVEMNWNPMGHEPEGVYQDVPHFDFHFYTISKAARDSIVPTNPEFEKKGGNLPPAEFVPPFNVALGPPGVEPAKLVVPMMGLHWVDLRSAELQKLLGKPEGYKPFTATFIYGSWDGRFHFWEPMVTRAFILSKKEATDPAVRDQLIPISTPAKYQTAGYYPAAYRVAWDATAREYRIALTELALRK
jgi:hypothetical protein